MGIRSLKGKKVDNCWPNWKINHKDTMLWCIIFGANMLPFAYTHLGPYGNLAIDRKEMGYSFTQVFLPILIEPDIASLPTTLLLFLLVALIWIVNFFFGKAYLFLSSNLSSTKISLPHLFLCFSLTPCHYFSPSFLFVTLFWLVYSLINHM